MCSQKIDLTIVGPRASTDNAMSFDGAAFAFIFDSFCRRCDLATSVREAYGAALGLAIFRGDGLEKQAVGCCASCEAVSRSMGTEWNEYLHQQSPYDSRHLKGATVV